MNVHLRTATFLTKLLDEQFKIFNIRFGLDPIIGQVPVLGDLIAAAVSFYIVWIGMEMKLPDHEIRRMVRNVLVDLLLGAVPVIGDLADIAYKANTRNLAILMKYSKEVQEGVIEKEAPSLPAR